MRPNCALMLMRSVLVLLSWRLPLKWFDSLEWLGFEPAHYWHGQYRATDSSATPEPSQILLADRLPNLH